ncbi:hypothetical protein T492DRAFT_433213, partial [Pavlovales sp. CCMP2436]
MSTGAAVDDRQMSTGADTSLELQSPRPSAWVQLDSFLKGENLRPSDVSAALAEAIALDTESRRRSRGLGSPGLAASPPPTGLHGDCYASATRSSSVAYRQPSGCAHREALTRDGLTHTSPAMRAPDSTPKADNELRTLGAATVAGPTNAATPEPALLAMAMVGARTLTHITQPTVASRAREAAVRSAQAKRVQGIGQGASSTPSPRVSPTHGHGAQATGAAVVGTQLAAVADGNYRAGGGFAGDRYAIGGHAGDGGYAHGHGGSGVGVRSPDFSPETPGLPVPGFRNNVTDGYYSSGGYRSGGYAEGTPEPLPDLPDSSALAPDSASAFLSNSAARATSPVAAGADGGYASGHAGMRVADGYHAFGGLLGLDVAAGGAVAKVLLLPPPRPMP